MDLNNNLANSGSLEEDNSNLDDENNQKHSKNNEFALFDSKMKLKSENNEILCNNKYIRGSGNTIEIIEDNCFNNNEDNEVHNSLKMSNIIPQNSQNNFIDNPFKNNNIGNDNIGNFLKKDENEIKFNRFDINNIQNNQILNQNQNSSILRKKNFIYNIYGNLYAGLNDYNYNYINNDNNIIISDLQNNSININNFNNNINMQSNINFNNIFE